MGKGDDPEPDDYLAESQTLTHYRFKRKLYPRLPYGSETFGAPAPVGRRPCRHCGAVRDQLHEPLCDYEQCPVCGEQVMSCDCGIYPENAVRGAMMAVKDIRQYAPLLGCRLDSARMKKFLATWDVEPVIDDRDNFPVGEIEGYAHGFDVVLAFNERWGTPKRGGKSPVWAAYMRFFGPEYGKKRKIAAYTAPILGDVTLPTTRGEVRAKLGPPTRDSDSGQVCDEYDQDDCIVRFCYPAGKEFVVFVELAAWSVIDREEPE